MDNSAHGISAVLLPRDDLETAVLDLAAVLEGLVADRFEILLITPEPPFASNLQARAPGLPLRVVSGASFADGCDDATFDLVFVGAPDGQFDVRELNHLLEAIEGGADVATGYRPRRTDLLVRTFQRWGWKVHVDCAFGLFKREVWLDLRRQKRVALCCAQLLANVRRLGYS